MDEVKFVLKCFAFSALLLVITQIRSGGMTIEEHIQGSLVNSEVSDFVNKAADGGVKLIKDGWQYTQDSYIKWKTEDHSEPQTDVHAQKKSDFKIDINSEEDTEPAVQE